MDCLICCFVEFAICYFVSFVIVDAVEEKPHSKIKNEESQLRPGRINQK